MNRPTVIYRWIVFLLAAFYCLRMIFFSSYAEVAGPFRFLTVWALFASFFCASRMIALVEGRSTRRWDGIVGMTAVLNGMVVLLYWRLYFADPRSVTPDGQLGAAYLELYLHGLGPLLQWIDALFIHRSFRRPWVSLLALFAVIGAYICWIELVVAPLNATPRGTVTTGLPYPFLNNLPLADRALFYVTNIAVAVVLLGIFCALAWAIRRRFPRPATL